MYGPIAFSRDEGCTGELLGCMRTALADLTRLECCVQPEQSQDIVIVVPGGSIRQIYF